MNNILTKKGISVFGVIILLIVVAVCVAYVITEYDKEKQNSNGILSPLDTIQNTGSIFSNNDKESFDSDNLLLKLSNCYYEIYDSDLLKRNETFDIEREVEKHVSEFQKFVPTVLWVDYYLEQCGAIER